MYKRKIEHYLKELEFTEQFADKNILCFCCRIQKQLKTLVNNKEIADEIEK